MGVVIYLDTRRAPPAPPWAHTFADWLALWFSWSLRLLGLAS